MLSERPTQSLGLCNEWDTERLFQTWLPFRQRSLLTGYPSAQRSGVLCKGRGGAVNVHMPCAQTCGHVPGRGHAREHASGGEHTSAGRPANASLGVCAHVCACPAVGRVPVCVRAHVCACAYVLVSISGTVLLSSGHYNNISEAGRLNPLTFLCHSSGSTRSRCSRIWFLVLSSLPA